MCVVFRKRWWRGTVSNRRTLWEQIYSLPRLASSLPLRLFLFQLLHYIKPHVEMQPITLRKQKLFRHHILWYNNDRNQ